MKCGQRVQSVSMATFSLDEVHRLEQGGNAVGAAAAR